MTRSTSYILVSSSAAPEPETEVPDYAGALPDTRPRFCFFLPAIAVLDAAATVGLGWLIVRREEERQKLVLAVAACALLRASTIAIVGVSKRIKDLGIIVAAVCILSALYNVSVANLLFQARSKPDTPTDLPPANTNSTDPAIAALLYLTAPLQQSALRLSVRPTMTVLISTQMAFTLFEWISYIAIVGVRVPPGGNPVKAKRWARSLSKDPRYRSSHIEASSLYTTDSEPESEPEEEEEAPLVRTPIQSPQKGYGSIRSPQAGVGLTPFPTTPNEAELAMSDEDDEEDDDEDPDEIIDIPNSRSLQRQASRRRLVLAAHPERRVSGNLGIGGAPPTRQSSTGEAVVPAPPAPQAAMVDSPKKKRLPAWLTKKRQPR